MQWQTFYLLLCFRFIKVLIHLLEIQLSKLLKQKNGKAKDDCTKTLLTPMKKPGSIT
jgi:hypothetical protein